MVKIDFTSYKSFATCPDWWRNFVSFTVKGLGSNEAIIGAAIDNGLEKYNALSIDHPTEEGDLLCLVFASQKDYEEFVIYWRLRGPIENGI